MGEAEAFSYYNYERLLDRAYSLLPKKAPAARRERLVIPKPEIMISGKKTFITNFKQICEILNREPRLVLRFLLKELAVPGEIEDQAAIIQGEISPKVIVSLMDRFVRDYVICPVCKSPDTILKKERRLMVLRCMACGAVSPVRPF